jgi:hypothetical protein
MHPQRFLLADGSRRNAGPLLSRDGPLQPGPCRNEPFGPFWMWLHRTVPVEPLIIDHGNRQPSHTPSREYAHNAILATSSPTPASTRIHCRYVAHVFYAFNNRGIEHTTSH